jgi:type II secretory pathway predicted ATPase ExeA
MYANHFGMRSEAFSLTPDPAFLYLSPAHAEALASLKVGLASHRGLMVMIAEVGMGKTTLLYSLLSDLGAGVHAAYISNTRLAFDDLLRQALADFGVACESRERFALLSTLNGFLHRCAAEGSTAALVIDEAQNLDDDAFENLRLLSNFETYDTKLLQIVLVGQPELEAKLRQAHLRQVAERVAVRCHINPLSREESTRYIEHRLRCAGGSIDLFTPAALRLVLRRARGIPRRINILCHNALLFTYGRDERRVSRSVVRAAVREREGRGLVALGRRWHGRVTIGRRWRGRLGRSAGRSATPRSRFLPWWAGVGFAAGIVTSLIWGGSASQTSPPHTTGTMSEWVARGGEAPDAAQPPDDHQDAAPTTLAPASVAAVPRVALPSLLPAAEASATGESNDVRDHENSRANPGPFGTGRASVAPAGQQPNGARSSFREVVVPRGATLLGLVRQLYGGASPDLIERIKTANPRIVDVNHILAGDRLRFPETESERLTAPGVEEAPTLGAGHE